MKKNERIFTVTATALDDGTICAEWKTTDIKTAWELFDEYVKNYSQHPWVSYQIIIRSTEKIMRRVIMITS